MREEANLCILIPCDDGPVFKMIAVALWLPFSQRLLSERSLLLLKTAVFRYLTVTPKVKQSLRNGNYNAAVFSEDGSTGACSVESEGCDAA